MLRPVVIKVSFSTIEVSETTPVNAYFRHDFSKASSSYS